MPQCTIYTLYDRLKSQIPDIKTSLDIVQHMKSRKVQNRTLQLQLMTAFTLRVYGYQPVCVDCFEFSCKKYTARNAYQIVMVLKDILKILMQSVL